MRQYRRSHSRHESLTKSRNDTASKNWSTRIRERFTASWDRMRRAGVAAGCTIAAEFSTTWTTIRPSAREKRRRARAIEGTMRGTGPVTRERRRCQAVDNGRCCPCSANLTRTKITIHREPRFLDKLPEEAIIYLCPRHLRLSPLEILLATRKTRAAGRGELKGAR